MSAAPLRRRGALCVIAFVLGGCFNTLDWREYSSAEGRYSITLPGKVLHDKRVLSAPSGSVTMAMDSTSAGAAVFGVGYVDYPADFLTAAHADGVFDAVRDALVKNVGAARFDESPAAGGAGQQGRKLHAEGKVGGRGLVLDARLLRAENRIYQVVAISEDGAARLDQNALDVYFNSFRITR